MEIKFNIPQPCKIVAISGSVLFLIAAFLPIYGNLKLPNTDQLIVVIISVLSLIMILINQRMLSIIMGSVMAAYSGLIYYMVMLQKQQAVENFSKIFNEKGNNDFADNLIAAASEQQFSLSIGFALLLISSIVVLICAFLDRK
jgi:drug/metabolite transporter superfamily protein YnfA